MMTGGEHSWYPGTAIPKVLEMVEGESACLEVSVKNKEST